MCSDYGLGMTLCCSIDETRSVQNCMPMLRIGTKVMVEIIVSCACASLTRQSIRRSKQKTPSFSARGFVVQHCRSVGHAARAVDAHDAHALADPENFVFLNLLHVGTHAAVVFTYGDFNTLRAGQAFFGR